MLLITPAMTGETFVAEARLDGSRGGQEKPTMSEEDYQQPGTDEQEHARDGLAVDRRTALKGGAAGLGLLALGGLGSSSAVASNGADKIYVAGSTREEYRLDTKTDGNASQEFTLMEGSIKTSTPTDLYLMAQTETALWTNIKSTGKDETSQANAGLTCWVEIDGVPVPVSYDYPNDWVANRQEASEVVFNYRDFKVETSFLGDIQEITEDDEYLALWLKTRSTHGFNWAALDLGSGDYDSSTNVHDVALKGRLEVYADDNNAQAKAVVGPRTFIGVPAKLANDATV